MRQAEKRHLDRLSRLGCVICLREHGVHSPPEIHHINSYAMGKKSGNGLAIPLCPAHHRLGGRGVAVHASKQDFEALYGSELFLLNEVILMLEEEGVT